MFEQTSTSYFSTFDDKMSTFSDSSLKASIRRATMRSYLTALNQSLRFATTSDNTFSISCAMMRPNYFDAQSLPPDLCPIKCCDIARCSYVSPAVSYAGEWTPFI
jgi:hypothetical protein